MIRKAECTAFKDLLNPSNDSNRVFVIPNYQRGYAWTKKNCEELYEDIMECDKGYFLGSMIWVNGNTKDIIDGQQRTTTVSLLLIAIYEKIKDLSFSDDDEEKISARLGLKKLLISGGKTARLLLQKHNQDDYQYLINLVVLKQPAMQPAYFGSRRIANNYKFFQEILKGKTEDELFDLYERVSSLNFVAIEVDDHQSAFLLFETMNNRGLDLSPIDLIKSKYIACGGDVEKWNAMIGPLGENSTIREQFFRNNYNAFRVDYKKGKDFIADKVVKSNLIAVYDQIIKNDIDFIDDLIIRAGFYSKILGIIKAEDADLDRMFQDFIRAQATSAYILVLYFYNHQIPYDFKDGDLVDLLRIILKFFVRRNLTNYPGTGSIPGLSMDIISSVNDLETKNATTIIPLVRKKLQERSASSERVKEILEGNIYEENRDMTRYLLCELSRKDESNGKEIRFYFWEVDKKQRYVWTIEHIFPEGENIPKEWVDMIADGDEVKAKEILKEYTHKIGNLTLTGYNSELSNKPFCAKRDKKDEKGNYTGYRNGLSLNEYIVQQEEWTVEKIKSRGEKLVKDIMDWLKL